MLKALNARPGHRHESFSGRRRAGGGMRSEPRCEKATCSSRHCVRMMSVREADCQARCVPVSAAGVLASPLGSCLRAVAAPGASL